MSRSKSRQKTWMPITNHDVTLVSFAFVNAFRITFWDHQHIKLCIMRHLIANFIWQKRTFLTTFWIRKWYPKYLGNNVAFHQSLLIRSNYVAKMKRDKSFLGLRVFFFAWMQKKLCMHKTTTSAPKSSAFFLVSFKRY